MLTNIFTEAGVEQETAEEASRLIMSHEKKVIAFSGKIASGKDTVGGALAKLLFADEYTQLAFGNPLKEEVQAVINIVSQRNGESTDDIAQVVSVHSSIPYEDAIRVVAWLRDDINTYGEATVKHKTPGVRAALQCWGTEIRRIQNPNYFAHKTVKNVAEQVVKGDNSLILITDARFVNELEAMLSLHAFTIRLQVTPAAQKRRLKIRDGHDIIPESASETDLDDKLDMFHVVIDNSEDNIGEVMETLIPQVRGFYE